MKNEQAQRRIIAAALIPSTYEQLLAENYITGTLTIRHAIELLEDYKLKQVATCPLMLGKHQASA